MSRSNKTFIVAFLILAVFVSSIAWFTWPIGVIYSPVEYWKAWATGNIAGMPNENRLQKGFNTFFKKGQLSTVQKSILQSAHHKIPAKGTMIYQWSDMSRAHAGTEEGSRYYQVTVDISQEVVIEYSFGVLID